jgi:hypothetical protein
MGDFMTTEEIIESIQAKIARLEQVRTLLNGRTGNLPSKVGAPGFYPNN